MRALNADTNASRSARANPSVVMRQPLVRGALFGALSLAVAVGGAGGTAALFLGCGSDHDNGEADGDSSNPTLPGSGSGQGSRGRDGTDGTDGTDATDGARSDAPSNPEGGAGGNDGGCAANLASDPNHCGRCGHACLGGLCANSACLPFVVTTNRTVYGNPLRIETDALYFESTLPPPNATKRDLIRHPFSGAETTLLAGATFASPTFDLYGNDLYYTTTTKQFVRIPRTGGAPTTVLPSVLGGAIPVFTPTTLFWLDFLPGGSALRRAPFTNGVAGTPTLMVGGGLDVPIYMVLAKDVLYIADRSNGYIHSVSTTAVTPMLMLIDSSASMPFGIVADGDDVFWVNGGSTQIGKKKLGSIVHFKAGQAQPNVLVDNITGAPHGIALTTTDIFWITMGGTAFVNSPPAGTLMRLSRTGGAPIQIASGLALPDAIVANDQRVCWSENGAPATNGSGIVYGAGLLKCIAL